MAVVTSLGIHKPSAVPYLISESLLPPAPSPTLYRWQTYDHDGGDYSVQDELLVTENCVVWSRGGVVQRLFRFEVEEEKVLKAVLTWFPEDGDQNARDTARVDKNRAGAKEQIEMDMFHPPNGGRQPRSSGWSTKAQSYTAQLRAKNTPNIEKDVESSQRSKAFLRNSRSRAIVVFLRSQAHVYLLSGTSHVVHLPFEVESVLPAPRGLFIQRKVPAKSQASKIAAPLPSVPPNSFISTQQSQLWSLPGSQQDTRGMPKSPFPGWNPSTFLSSMIEPHSRDFSVDLPRLFSLTDPLAEMGLVVTAFTQHKSPNSGNSESVKTSMGPLSSAETLIYLTSSNEDSRVLPSTNEGNNLILALTANSQTRMYTVWNVSYVKGETGSNSARQRLPSGMRSKHRSSLGPGAGTGATTPVMYAPNNPRESFGGMQKNANGLGPPGGNLLSKLRNTGGQKSETNDLVSALDPDLDGRGVPAKQSRRVSSLLARTDLSTNHDRLAFTDLATSHGANAIPGVAGSFRRGDSLGGHAGRASFGTVVGMSVRDSLASNSSTVLNTSIHDTPVDDLLEELNAGGDFEGFEEMGLQESVESLRKEVVMTPVKSIPMEQSLEVGIPQTQPQPQQSRAFTLFSPQLNGMHQDGDRSVILCVVERESRRLVIVNMKDSFMAEFVDFHVATNIIDAVKITDKEISRLLVLSETPDGHGSLTLEAPWSPVIKIDLPERLMVSNPYQIGQEASPLKEARSLKRVFSDGPKCLLGLEHESSEANVDVMDEKGKLHRLNIQMKPKNILVQNVLDVFRWVLPGTGGESLLVAWWEAHRWLYQKSDKHGEEEWTAIVMVLWMMAVPFLKNATNRSPVKQRRRKNALLRSSSGANIDLEKWDAMLDEESGSNSPAPLWMSEPSWSWIAEEDAVLSAAVIDEQAQLPKSAPPPISSIRRKNSFLVECITLTREFLVSAAGVPIAGDNGYLPTAAGKDAELRRTALATVLVGLHLLREELKLDTSTAKSKLSGAEKLTPVLAQIGTWLGWDDWGWVHPGYYSLEDVSMEQWLFHDGVITGFKVPAQPFEPPSIYSWISKSLNRISQPAFMTLQDILTPGGHSSAEWALENPSSHPWYKLTPRTARLTYLFGCLNKVKDSSTDIIEVMAKTQFDISLLESLPEGILTPLREAISNCQANPPTKWDDRALCLVGRDDLRILISADDDRADVSRWSMAPTHEALRDVHSICHYSLESETVGAFDGSTEIDRQAITRLVFKEDRRFAEASRLVNSLKTTTARCMPEPDWNEADLFEAQKELVQIVAIRTLAVPSGRGPLYYSARVPLLTEKFPISGFNLSCIMKPSNNTVSADRSAFTEEKVCWAFFHAGVSAGLSISRDAKGIDTSWIVYNKPQELSNRHAGFLLALGLNGHLKSIAKWVAFKYLTPKHTMTSIGLLLGLSASYLGTMDTLVTRLLSIHVTRMLPPGAAELNLSPLTQTTGIMGIGLLYCNTQHRRMSEVMLSEIEHIDIEDPSMPTDILRDEGYRLAAGFALGLINLGRGKDLVGLHDMRLVERLLAIAVGSKKVNIVHILDRSTAAATMAIALIFMKSQDQALAHKIDVPDTVLQFDYVRPDVFLLRTVAKHLIMWSKIQPSFPWIEANLPNNAQYKSHYLLKTITHLTTANLPLFNIVGGLCLAIALRFAGSGNETARNILGHYLDQFMRLCRLPALTYDQKLARNTVRNCQDLLALASAAIMAGTGDLFIFRRLRSLHGRVDIDTPYGSHLAAHIAIGLLFLGGGNFTLGTSDIAVASLLAAFYPLFPTDILDNKSHLQAFRHFWVLATEPRTLVARDVATHRPVSIPLVIRLRSGEALMQSAPCLLPQLSDVATVETKSPAYWRVVLDFAQNPSHRAAFARNQTIFVKKRAAHDTLNDSSIFHASLLALGEQEVSQQAWEWLFTLPSLRDFERSERALIVPRETGASVGLGLEGTVVDAKLTLMRALKSGNRDALWNVRLVLEWAERARVSGRRSGWLGEGLQRLRAAVWMEGKEEVARVDEE
ncbi:MAG: Anaphase-promoting complex subunit 1 [Vezdaea acicularis]|nr:MAG: Anaphase-promoting complex subunit 1 [Vezdaea acicularis]